jgi:Esterase-like activity of phytase
VNLNKTGPKTEPMKTQRHIIVLLAILTLTPILSAQADSARDAAVLHHYTLVPTSMTALGYSAEEIADAQARGLTFTDQPSIGSGLQRLQGNFYLGVSDRGPSFVVGSARIFPLPQFTPTIVIFHATRNDLVLDSVLPLVGQSGAGVTGIPNSATEDSSPFLDEVTPLPFNPSGMDIEDIHLLPCGRFILVEEYSPSVVIADQRGEVLRRYTPVSKTLPGADYPIHNTLPDVFKNRRANRGFESIPVSANGRTAYTVTQSPLGATSVGSPYRDSRVVRIVRMDVSDPLNLQVTGQFALLMSPAADYPVGNAQRDLKISSAAWVAHDVLLLLELNDVAGIGGVRLTLVDLRQASNFHGLPVAETLDLEDVNKGPAFLGLTPATATVVYQQFETDAVKLLPSGKLEGLSILNANDVAISTDNDFGIGDVPGTSSQLTVLRLSDRLPLQP